MSTNINKSICRYLRLGQQLSTKVAKRLILGQLNKNKAFTGSGSQSNVKKQREITLYYFSLLYLMGIFIHLFTPVGEFADFYIYANLAQGSIILLILALYNRKNISIEKAIAIILIVCTLEIITEMLYQVINNGIHGSLNIMTNMTLLCGIATLSMISYIKYLSLCISVMSTSAYLACAYLIPSQEMFSYAYIIITSFICITFIGSRLAQTYQLIHTENKQYKEERNLMIDYMQLTKEQWKELMEALRITNKRITPDQKREAIELVKERLNIRLTYQMQELFKEEQDYSAALIKHCPALTDMELKIANLIIKGMSSSQISSTINTTISTITTLRSRIRARFELSKEISLQSYLQRIVEEEK